MADKAKTSISIDPEVLAKTRATAAAEERDVSFIVERALKRECALPLGSTDRGPFLAKLGHAIEQRPQLETQINQLLSRSRRRRAA